MGMGREWREALAAIWAAIHREADARVAPFTRGGLLDLSSPNIVGHLAAEHGGTGGTGGAGREALYWDGETVVYGGDGLYWGV